MKKRLSMWIGLSLAVAVSAFAVTGAPERLQKAGGWGRSGKTLREVQAWSMDVARDDDGAIRGSIAVEGSPLLGRGVITGRIAGESLAGTISDEEGHYVASFSGTVGPEGMSGKYVDRTGEEGEWESSGALK